jgi:hypothetical protein
MTRQANICISRYGVIRSKNLAAYVIATTTLIAMMSVITFTSGHSINAQMMTGDRGGFRNMNTSLSQAIIVAEQSVGNNSSAIAAFGKALGTQLVYTIILGTPGTEFYDVTVDPGNGHVLTTEELSQKELEKMHLAHSQKVLAEPHLMNNTFVH